MTKFLAAVFLIGIFGIILNYQNCGNTTGSGRVPASGDDQPVTVSGTVKKLDVDGCNKVIVSDSDSSTQFIPRGVNDKDLIEGAKVSITGYVVDDEVSACMAGKIFKVNFLNGFPAAY